MSNDVVGHYGSHEDKPQIHQILPMDDHGTFRFYNSKIPPPIATLEHTGDLVFHLKQFPDKNIVIQFTNSEGEPTELKFTRQEFIDWMIFIDELWEKD